MIDFRLYLITDRARCAPRALQAVVGEAVTAGVRAVQLREKDLSADELEPWIARLAAVTRAGGAKLIVNRDASITADEEAFLAASLEADGFHFPEHTPFPAALRKRFPGRLVGISTHTRQSALAATLEGADFVTFGPVFATPSKARYGPPLGVDALCDTCAAVKIPVFALGGVTPENAAACVEAGAQGVAAVSAVMEAPDISAAVQKFARALGGL